MGRARPFTAQRNVLRRCLASVAPPAVDLDAPEAPCLKLALVGRPNVGKSTLFNRLSSSRAAIVHAQAGTTRDRQVARCELGGVAFSVTDTGGLEDAAAGSMAARINEQAAEAVREANVIFFMIDARAGVLPSDQYFARWLRKVMGQGGNVDGVAVHVLANKAEAGHASALWEPTLTEAWALGLGPATPISAEHGDGLGDLVSMLLEAEAVQLVATGGVGGEHDASTAALALKQDKQHRGQSQRKSQRKEQHLKEQFGAASEAAEGSTGGVGGEGAGRSAHERAEAAAEYSSVLRLAIVGRPNAGKSTLLNQLLGEERVITSPTAGTTRDAVAAEWDFAGKQVELVDTAGIRRYGRRDHSTKLDMLAVQDAKRAIDSAQVVVLVVDAEEGHLTRTDLSIAQLVLKEGRALVVVANKVDLFDQNASAKIAPLLRGKLNNSLAQALDVPVLAMSASEGFQVEQLMPMVVAAHGRWTKRVGTGVMNRWLQKVQRLQAPPSDDGKAVRLRYLTQISAGPPSFRLFVSRGAAGFSESYKRFLVNQLRSEFGLKGLPIRLSIKEREQKPKFVRYAANTGAGGRGGGGRGGRGLRGRQAVGARKGRQHKVAPKR